MKPAGPRAYVAVTDNDWLTFLSRLPDVDEVNFWLPGGKQLRRLTPGEPVLFKLHAPINKIAGGAFFSHGTLMPVSLVWDAFAEKNGASSFLQMRERIERYRRVAPNPREDYMIGCLILRDPFFLPRDLWLEPPRDFHRSTQQGKYYDLSSPIGQGLWAAVQDRLQGVAHARQVAESTSEPGPMYGDPIAVRPRLGQGAFRLMVTDLYQRRCAVTGEKVLPVLQAAHIRPVSAGGDHRTDNGILLRSDVHALFDRGYVTISPDHRFRVSSRLKTEFNNGEHYYRYRDSEIALPERIDDRPGREFLEWHADTVYKG